MKEDLNEIAIFTKVAEGGSFSGAARMLGLPKSTVSRKVGLLEERLGVRLFQRTTRRVRLTDQGEQYYQGCVGALAMIEQSTQSVIDSQSELAGTLRLSAPLAFTVEFLWGWITEFMAAHPNVFVEFKATNEYLDLIDQGIDLAIRTGTLADSSLVSRKLGDASRHLYASPAYLDKYGTLENAGDIQNHHCIVLGERIDSARWHLRCDRKDVAVKLKARIAVDSMELVMDSAIAGFGIAQLPSTLADSAVKARQLKAVLTAYTIPAVSIYAVYPSRRHLSVNVRAFLDFIVAKASEIKQWQTGR